MNIDRTDLVAFAVAGALAACFVVPATRELYETAYRFRPILVSFVKFAVLATLGEMAAARLATGAYWRHGFGVGAKMVVWGLLGIAIYLAFGVYSRGVPPVIAPWWPGGRPPPVYTALGISVVMNVTFAPVMMLTHHVTDLYIARNGGRFPLAAFRVRPILDDISWDRMWGLVFRITIPLFWIPAHTITFLLPERYRTLFAAALSIVLGLILGIAASRKKEIPDEHD